MFDFTSIDGLSSAISTSYVIPRGDAVELATQLYEFIDESNNTGLSYPQYTEIQKQLETQYKSALLKQFLAYKQELLEALAARYHCDIEELQAFSEAFEVFCTSADPADDILPFWPIFTLSSPSSLDSLTQAVDEFFPESSEYVVSRYDGLKVVENFIRAHGRKLESLHDDFLEELDESLNAQCQDTIEAVNTYKQKVAQQFHEHLFECEGLIDGLTELGLRKKAIRKECAREISQSLERDCQDYEWKSIRSIALLADERSREINTQIAAKFTEIFANFCARNHIISTEELEKAVRSTYKHAINGELKAPLTKKDSRLREPNFDFLLKLKIQRLKQQAKNLSTFFTMIKPYQESLKDSPKVKLLQTAKKVYDYFPKEIRDTLTASGDDISEELLLEHADDIPKEMTADIQFLMDNKDKLVEALKTHASSHALAAVNAVKRLPLKLTARKKALLREKDYSLKKVKKAFNALSINEVLTLLDDLELQSKPALIQTAADIILSDFWAPFLDVVSECGLLDSLIVTSILKSPLYDTAKKESFDQALRQYIKALTDISPSDEESGSDLDI